MARGDASVATTGTKKKKKKGIVKSIAKGLSFKKKKQKPDDESVVGVALERDIPNSPATAPSTSLSIPARKESRGGGSTNGAVSAAVESTTAKPIQVVLLLMDPSSRRFELLQLEFDSNKAMVSDVIRQIQSSATETTLRDMNYVGVCDQLGVEMIASMKLSKFCRGNEIVMAIPRGLNGKETVKLAGPILGDPKVADMLAPCGVKIKKVVNKSSRSAGSKLGQISEDNTVNKSIPRPKEVPNSPSAKESKKKSNVPTIMGILLSVVLALTIKRHVDVTKPLVSGDVLLPGQWKSQCGIFGLFPEEVLEKLPMDKLSKSCGPSSTSLELGKDGTLRYFKASSGPGDDMKKLAWSVDGNKQCSEEDGDYSQCSGAKFEKVGNYWYVDVRGTRTSLNSDVIRDFTN